MKTNIIIYHTFNINDNNGNIYSRHGEYAKAKKEVLKFLENLEENKMIGILWTRQEHLFNIKSNLYEGKNIENIIFKINNDKSNWISVKEAIDFISNEEYYEKYDKEMIVMYNGNKKTQIQRVEKIGNYKMREDIEVYRINEMNVALDKWNGEEFIECFQVADNLIDIVSKEKIEVRPIYRFEKEEIDLDVLKENSEEYNKAMEIVDFKIL